MLRLVLLVSVLSVAWSAGSVTWGAIGVSWNIESPYVTFTVAMAAADLSKFDYWGFGFNEDGSDDDDEGTDFYIVYKDGTGVNRVVDSVLNDESGPTTDSVNDASIITHAVDASGNFVTSFSRLLDTGDANDYTLVEGTDYELFLRAGTVKDGAPQWVDDYYNKHFEVEFSNTEEKTKDYSEEDYSPALTYFIGLLGLILFVPY